MLQIFSTFSNDVKLRRTWKNRVARKSGKDGFQATVNAFIFEQIAVIDCALMMVMKVR